MIKGIGIGNGLAVSMVIVLVVTSVFAMAIVWEKVLTLAVAMLLKVGQLVKRSLLTPEDLDLIPFYCINDFNSNYSSEKKKMK